eukprot:8197866-Pyramimonas_sp.AAC.1
MRDPKQRALRSPGRSYYVCARAPMLLRVPRRHGWTRFDILVRTQPGIGRVASASMHFCSPRGAR